MFLVKKIRFKNFRSYGNQFTEINLIKSGSTVITAPNGSGKSTILMAIEFALFGKVSNGINKNDLVNTINKKDLVVEIECETKGKEILIRRGIKPNIFEIFIDGKLVDQEASTRDYQTQFEEEILGFNISSFRQVVSISGGSYTPFLLLSAGQRRKIVEELLNLTVFSKMYIMHLASIAQTKENLQSVENEIEKLQASLASLKKGLETLSEQEEGYRKTIEENIEKANSKIQAINDEIRDQNVQIEKLQSQADSYEVKIAKKTKLQEYGRDMRKKIQKITDFISFFRDNDTCPTCTQPITEDFKAQVIEAKANKRTELQSSLENLNALLQKTESEIEKLDEVLKKIRSLENNIHTNTKRISDLQAYISEQQKILGKKHFSSADLTAEIKKTSQDISELKARRLELLEEKQYNEVISAIIKDNGIKSKIIAQYVPRMNQEINKFLELLDLGISFEINENFEERILSRFKDELSYMSFSAGERARIDIAILFTWRELAKLKNSLNCNLLFLDEIFDAVLDDQGLESFINLLKYHLSDTNVFLISHRPEVVDKFESNLRIVKSANFSRIE